MYCSAVSKCLVERMIVYALPFYILSKKRGYNVLQISVGRRPHRFRSIIRLYLALYRINLLGKETSVVFGVSGITVKVNLRVKTKSITGDPFDLHTS